LLDTSVLEMQAPLIEAANHYVDAQGGGQGNFTTAVPGVHVMRSFQHIHANHTVHRPSLCIVLQGGKEVQYGGETLGYQALQCLIAGIEMPACGRLVDASPSVPYLGVTIDIDVAVMREVLMQLDQPPKPTDHEQPSIYVVDINKALADCTLRLLQMVNTPSAVPILAPQILRELYFWLLTGPYGSRVCGLALPDNHMDRISRAIIHLRKHYTASLNIDQLAEVAGMSSSSFRSYFKTLTSTTPIQFQKHLRLLEARRLMVSEAANVTEAAFQVGYNSISQFSREYARLFGMAPKRDAMDARSDMAEA
jgi:AraC-like DNA-binding protein